MKVMLTGGCGFIGSAMCHLLVGKGHEVVNIDALTYAACPESLVSLEKNPAYVFEHANICDFERMSRFFRQHQPDAVVHMAAESHVDRSIDNSSVVIQTNIVGT